jgi:hypothetical protein
MAGHQSQAIFPGGFHQFLAMLHGALPGVFLLRAGKVFTPLSQW